MRVLRISSIALLGVGIVSIASSTLQQRRDPSLVSDIDQHFFVCGSGIDGMDGKYVLQNHDGDSVRSDADTPVYLREDEDDEGIAGIPGRQQRQEQQDFRLFRHRGFWMFADVGVWPPATHFRCDPTKRELVPHDIDVVSVCQMDLGTPPSVGYSPAQPNHAVRHLALSEAACSSATGGVASSQSQHQGDATDRAAAAAAALASRVSEL